MTLTTKGLYDSKYNDALSRDILFDLTFADYERLVQKTHCFYTGVKFVDDRGSASRRTIDRIDPDKGYTVENCVACTHAANNAKNVLFEEPRRSRLTLWQMQRMLLKLWWVGFKDNRPRNER